MTATGSSRRSRPLLDSRSAGIERVDLPATLPFEVVVGLTAGVAVALFLCGYLLFTHLCGGSDDGTVDAENPPSPPRPPVGGGTGSDGDGDALEQRLERRSDPTTVGAPPSRTRLREHRPR